MTGTNASVSNRDLSLLAPLFRERVEAAITECQAAGYDVTVAEATRSQERQAYLYAQGRTRPGSRVTNAPTNLTSWHGYGLAIDFMDRKKGFNPVEGNDEPWFYTVAQIFKKHGLDWGGDWGHADTPHIQFGGLSSSPQAAHKSLKQRQGNAAVWALVGASETKPYTAPEPSHPPYIERGSTGEAVKLLQRKLNIVGPDNPGYGTFGPKTEAAVRAFQRAHNLNIDGEVGDKTWAAINSEKE